MKTSLVSLYVSELHDEGPEDWVEEHSVADLIGSMFSFPVNREFLGLPKVGCPKLVFSFAPLKRSPELRRVKIGGGGEPCRETRRETIRELIREVILEATWDWTREPIFDICFDAIDETLVEAARDIFCT